jgi:hypothetical protein
MLTAKECRKNAERCIDLASTATERDAALLLDIAERWLKLASSPDVEQTETSDVERST